MSENKYLEKIAAGPLLGALGKKMIIGAGAGGVAGASASEKGSRLKGALLGAAGGAALGGVAGSVFGKKPNLMRNTRPLKQLGTNLAPAKTSAIQGFGSSRSSLAKNMKGFTDV